MADYIKRSDILELSRIYYTPALREEAVPVKAIKNIPSADVVEVRHGKWVNPPKRKENVGYRNGFGIYYECSRCGFIEDYHANFCPNCGADMRGGT